MRVAHVWRAMADELALDYRVVAAIHEEELEAWHGSGAELVVYDRQIEEAARAAGGELKAQAADIERTTGLNAYRAAQSYLFYRRQSLEFYGRFPSWYEKESRVLEEFVGSFKVLTGIFERFTPDVCFYETPDLISHYMLLTLASQRGVFCYGLHFPSIFGDGKIMLTYGVSRQNVRLNYLYAHPELIEPSSFAVADVLLDQAGKKLHEMSYLTVAKSRPAAAGRLVGRLRRLADPAWWSSLPRSTRNRINEKWLSTRVIYEPPDKPYLVVFLQRQPEASTTAQAPRWVDQEKVIERIATSAPVGWTILVKENPRSYGVRGKRYFGPLLDIPNVRLCHPSVQTLDLLRECAGIVAITGTVGLEGILLGKRVVALGRPFYAACDGVAIIDTEEEIFPALLDPDLDPGRFAEARRTFLAALAQAVDDFGPPPHGKIWPAPSLAGVQLAEALRGNDNFVQKHGIVPELFGSPIDAQPPASAMRTRFAALKQIGNREQAYA
jgi:hypothetical protein